MNLYMTTFNKKLFDLTGKFMLKTYIDTKQEGDLLVALENLDKKYILKIISKEFGKNYSALIEKKIKFISVDKDVDFINWLERNKNITPEEHGGLATKKSNPDSFLTKNYRFSQWFRKIIGIKNCIEHKTKKHENLIFVDCDIQFKLPISKKIYNDVFLDKHSFCFYGEIRRRKDLGVESGFIGFKNNEKGLFVLKEWIDTFLLDKFIELPVWSDGGVFGLLFDKHKDLIKDLAYDTAENITKYKFTSDVIPRSILGKYILHNKGYHKKHI
jgi:hypothetical protein